VDRAHELRAEHVGEIGRNGRESAPVHGCDDAERGDEECEYLPFRGESCEHVERGAEREEYEIRDLAPERVGR